MQSGLKKAKTALFWSFTPQFTFLKMDTLISDDHRPSNLRREENSYIMLICTQTHSYLITFSILTI